MTEDHPGRFVLPSSCALGAFVVLLLFAAECEAEEITVARYSTVVAVPTAAQQDPLGAYIRTTFPDNVSRVGEAVDALLAGTGYRLAPEAAAHAARRAMLQWPLPDAHRTLGPLSVRAALELLAGPAFVLVEDPAHRLVSFEPCGVSAEEMNP